MIPETLGNLANWAAERLAVTSDSPRLDAELLLAKAADVSRSTIVAFAERVVVADVRDAFVQLIEQRCDDVPVAYLTGQREFYSLLMAVDSNVLVPRPETERIVEAALDSIAEAKSVAVLDLGTGSGAIALAIKDARPQADITAVDASEEALAIAQRNAAAHGLDVQFLKSDWFSAVEGRAFNLIVSNPPYVRSDDPALRGPLRHEPAAALDGGPDGLDAIRLIISAACEYLSTDGRLLVEHGDEQGEATRRLADQAGYRDVQTFQDLGGRDRVLTARAP